MKKILLFTALIVAAAGFGTGAFAEEAYVQPIKDYVASDVAPWLADAVVLDAIAAQNAKHADMNEEAIIAMDKQWRAEVEASSKPLIDATLGNALSEFLREKQAASDGLITEVFIMDNKGLNVGQSDVTSDYWQGDEAKFQKSYGEGAGAIFVDEAEKDESTQMLQSQVSLTIADGAGTPVGAVTIGINLDAL